eukprot:6180624-Pleurochrysis_carterae.AAC.3
MRLLPALFPMLAAGGYVVLSSEAVARYHPIQLYYYLFEEKHLHATPLAATATARRSNVAHFSPLPRSPLLTRCTERRAGCVCRRWLGAAADCRIDPCVGV